VTDTTLPTADLQLEIQRTLISDEAIERVHANANFGDLPKRFVVNQTVLKFACGYSAGGTATAIVIEHGLAKMYRSNPFKTPMLTALGRRYLWACFGKVSV